MSKFVQAKVFLERNNSFIFKLNITRPSEFFNLAQKRTNSSTATPKDVPKGKAYSDMTIGVPRETFLNEKRVAISPAVTSNFIKKGFNVLVEENAGVLSKFPNEQYAAAGATLVNSKSVYTSSDILLKVRAPDVNVS